MEAWRSQKNKFFDSEMAYSRGFDKEIIRILQDDIWPGSKVVVSDKKEDAEHNTDFLVFRPGERYPLRIQARIRRPDALKKYPDDVTLRNFLANNGILHDGDTELQKMLKGWGDYYFYGFDAGDGKHITHWLIMDSRKLCKIITDIGKEYGGQHTANNTGCGFLTYSRNEIYGAIEAEQETWY